KYTLKKNSFYVGVYGGKAEDIADAIWRKAPPAVDMNGDSSYTIADTDGYEPPYPEYVITWQGLKPVSVSVRVILRKSEYLPSDITDQVKSKVIAAFNGADGGNRARAAAALAAGRFYAGIYSIDPSNIDILSLALSRNGNAFSSSLQFGIDEIPTLDPNNISVELQEV
ncbi:hypothetical protein K5M56_08205, partial [Serratia marcescens]|nr:hypothetical protein [Serratia marcescens]